MRVALVLVAALALWGGGCGPQSSVAMISGRDDHGQLERAFIGLQRSPTDAEVVGTVEDGTFVKVTRREGPWAYVVAVGQPAEGWIEDHYLRGEAVRADLYQPKRVTFVDARANGSVVEVQVRYTEDGVVDWVPAETLREFGAR